MRLMVPLPDPEGPSMVSTGAVVSMAADYRRVRSGCRSPRISSFKLLIRRNKAR
jgi:hypothetical protein